MRIEKIAGKEIKELRKRLNMTQEQFAVLLGVTRVSVNKWEAGTVKPSTLANRELLRVKESERRGLS